MLRPGGPGGHDRHAPHLPCPAYRPSVVAGAVGHPVEVVGPLAHGSEDRPQHVDVAALAVGADEVRLAVAPAGQDLPHGRGVVVDVDPVADVAAVAVELGARAVDDVGDLPEGMNFSTCWQGP